MSRAPQLRSMFASVLLAASLLTNVSAMPASADLTESPYDLAISFAGGTPLLYPSAESSRGQFEVNVVNKSQVSAPLVFVHVYTHGDWVELFDTTAVCSEGRGDSGLCVYQNLQPGAVVRIPLVVKAPPRTGSFLLRATVQTANEIDRHQSDNTADLNIQVVRPVESATRGVLPIGGSDSIYPPGLEGD